MTDQLRFPFQQGVTPEPLPMEQHNPDTATLWTVHLAVEPVRWAEIASAVTTLPWTTGHIIGGDSWETFCEVARDDAEVVALHIYFTAADLQQAQVRGRLIAIHSAILYNDRGGFTPDYHVSTAADWSEPATP